MQFSIVSQKKCSHIYEAIKHYLSESNLNEKMEGKNQAGENKPLLVSGNTKETTQLLIHCRLYIVRLTTFYHDLRANKTSWLILFHHGVRAKKLIVSSNSAKIQCILFCSFLSRMSFQKPNCLRGYMKKISVYYLLPCLI